MHRVPSLILTAFAVVALAACSGGGAAASVTPPPDATASVTATNHAFSPGTITLPASKPTRLFFRNLDGETHNVAISRDAAATDRLFTGATITNAATVYDVPALAPGTYPFRCDVHPEMTGTITVTG